MQMLFKEQKTEIEQLKQEVDILQGAVDTGNATCEQCEQKHKAEIKGLREDYTRACTERDLRIITHDFIKAEAYKEFAEMLHEELRVYGIKDEFNKAVFLNIVDKAKKELVGDNNG